MIRLTECRQEGKKIKSVGKIGEATQAFLACFVPLDVILNTNIKARTFKTLMGRFGTEKKERKGDKEVREGEERRMLFASAKERRMC